MNSTEESDDNKINSISDKNILFRRCMTMREFLYLHFFVTLVLGNKLKNRSNIQGFLNILSSIENTYSGISYIYLRGEDFILSVYKSPVKICLLLGLLSTINCHRDNTEHSPICYFCVDKMFIYVLQEYVCNCT